MFLCASILACPSCLCCSGIPNMTILFSLLNLCSVVRFHLLSRLKRPLWQFSVLGIHHNLTQLAVFKFVNASFIYPHNVFAFLFNLYICQDIKIDLYICQAIEIEFNMLFSTAPLQGQQHHVSSDLVNNSNSRSSVFRCLLQKCARQRLHFSTWNTIYI